jgi:hypothetical protein
VRRIVTGRRQFGKLIAGTAGVVLVGGTARAELKGAGKLATLPWPYTPLDPEKVAARGFAGYGKAHCMYGAFEAVAGATAEALGEPYTSFPFDMFEYGAGGINGWATICGALNGAAAAFKVLSKNPGPLTDELFSWYERAALPDMKIEKAKFPNVASVAGSPLCHTSISRWCQAASKASYSAERKERCGVITACVARRAVELLNAQAAGKPFPVLPAGGGATACAKCHEKGGEVENTRAKMDCKGCHFHLGGEHPKI